MKLGDLPEFLEPFIARIQSNDIFRTHRPNQLIVNGVYTLLLQIFCCYNAGSQNTNRAKG